MGNFFSTQSAGDEDGSGQKWRQQAINEDRLRSDALEQAHQARRAGRREEARELQNKAKQHTALIDAHNARAAAAIFAHYNPPPYGTSAEHLARADLHRLHVAEALRAAEDHIAACRRARRTHTVLITGRGNHSRDGIARIKPAVEAFLLRENLRAVVNVPNPGCISVEIDVPKEKAGWAQSCVIM